MKLGTVSVVSSFALGLAMSAHAEIKVGDQAKYTLQMKESSSTPTLTYTSTMEVLSLNSTLQSAKVQQTLTQAGITLSQNAFDQDLSDISSPSTSDIQGCADLATDGMSATIESIRVKAGTFQACHLKSLVADPDGSFSDVYLSVVPFGFVKSTQKNPVTGALQDMELTSFRHTN